MWKGYFSLDFNMHSQAPAWERGKISKFLIKNKKRVIKESFDSYNVCY